jgi:hypothetical protein
MIEDTSCADCALEFSTRVNSECLSCKVFNTAFTHKWRPKMTDITKNNGGSTDYYDIPTDAKTLDDLIEHKSMSFGTGNMFKAVYRLGEKDHTSEVYDLNKIIYYSQRRLDILNNGKPKMSIAEHKSLHDVFDLR